MNYDIIGDIHGHSLWKPRFLLDATQIETKECDALEMRLKVPEIDIGQFGLTVDLRGDRKRTELRVRWWGYEATS